MRACHPNALLLLGEISTVISSGRQEDSWDIGSREALIRTEDNVEDTFHSLRDEIFNWLDWSRVWPLDYLDPFLELVKSPETSGKVTSAALQGIQRFLEQDLLGDSETGVSEAVQSIAEAVTQCKFESSTLAYDECVLNDILGVFIALVECDQVSNLSHENLTSVLQACYRIGHMRTEKGRHTSELLTHSAQRAMNILVKSLFCRLKDFELPEEDGASPMAVTPSSMIVMSDADESSSVEEESKDAEDQPTAIEDDVSKNAENVKSDMEKSHHEIVSLLPEIKVDSYEEEGNCALCYGIPALADVTGFIISMIGSKPSKHYPDIPLSGIDLMTTAIQSAGPNISSHPLLMNLLKQDLVKALFAASEGGSFRTLAGICQISLTLYSLFREHVLPQVEAILSLLIIPIAEGSTSTSFALRQTAMEGILDFCKQAEFLQTTYINFDCRLGHENLFERICGVLSKCGFPTSDGGVSSFHSVSMSGMSIILDSIRSGEVYEDSTDECVEWSFSDAVEYRDIWTPLCEGHFFTLDGSPTDDPNSSWALRAEKQLKSELTSVVEHFNRDQRKGFEYCQSLNLLPSPLTATSVARFLKSCPGLSKSAIGEVLGERDDFYEDIRTEFCNTFDFSGLRFDIALRLFMDAFRPPGEGQKIDRIVQSFGKKYYQQVPKSGLKSADAAYVLAFSVIMLNTDLHNSQNKRKMTLEDFARINRNTNEGDPMPHDLLSDIYTAISNDEFKISSECSPADLSHQLVFWVALANRSAQPRGIPIEARAMRAAFAVLRKDMFKLAWGPTLAAISVILDGSSNPRIVKGATQTLLTAAELSYRYKIDGVIDQILASLAKYTAVLDSESTKPLIAYGSSTKARSSVEVMFKIVDLYGDSIRSGWKYIIATVMKIFLSGLLTPAIIAVDGESLEEASERMPKAASRSKGSSSSIFARAINSLISIEADGDTEYADAGTEMLKDLAQKSINSCSIESLVNDSKFLVAESLSDLLNAIIWSGNSSLALSKQGEPTDTTELALELLFSLSLRNRDRISLIWPRIHEFLENCTSQESAEELGSLNERSIKGLMRISQRLLPYKEEIADMLLDSLSLIGQMHPAVVWELSPCITTDLITLISQSALHIRTENGWRTVTILIRISASREEVLPHSLQALQLACRNPNAVSVESYIPLLETCLQLIDSFKSTRPDLAADFLDCADSLFSWLSAQGEGSKPISREALLDLWLTSVGILTKGLCREPSQRLRDTSIAALQRTLMASSSLHLPTDMWIQAIQELLLPLVHDLGRVASNKSKSFSEINKSLRLVINMLSKVLLQYVPSLASDNDFGVLWENTFIALKDCMDEKNGEQKEIVPEVTKNLILVLAHQGTLTPDWKDGSGKSLWDITWNRAKDISPDLNPGILDLEKKDTCSEQGQKALEEDVAGDNASDDTKPHVAEEEELEPPACKQS